MIDARFRCESNVPPLAGRRICLTIFLTCPATLSLLRRLDTPTAGRAPPEAPPPAECPGSPSRENSVIFCHFATSGCSLRVSICLFIASIAALTLLIARCAAVSTRGVRTVVISSRQIPMRKISSALFALCIVIQSATSFARFVSPGVRDS